MSIRRFIFAAAITLTTVGAISMKGFFSNKTHPDLLRVAFPYSKPATAYEPARIHLAPEYIFLENIFSPLVEMAPKGGKVIAGVAERTYWNKDELHLVIRNDLKTVSGRPITAKDAEFSIKRLMVLPGNTHGDFKELLCGAQGLKSVDDRCEGINVQGNELVLKTTTAGRTFLAPMLTAIDFAIIPRSSVDPQTLKIIDFKNTSGPYYVAKDSASGDIELRANPNHYHYSPLMPQVIQLVPTDVKKIHASLDDFKSDRVDFITTIDADRADDVIAFSRAVSDGVLYTTMNIRSFVATFTQRGTATFSERERFAIGSRLREAFAKALSGKNGYETSRQFFPSFGDGALDKPVLAKLDEKFQTAGELPKIDRIKIGLVRIGNVAAFSAPIRAVFPDAEIVEIEKNPDFLKYDSVGDMPLIAISGPDNGFLEDIGLISYSLNAGFFGMTVPERKAWIQHYMSIEDKDQRLELLRAAHEKALSEAITVPLLVAPYAALARKPWKVGLSTLYANCQLWLIQKN